MSSTGRRISLQLFSGNPKSKEKNSNDKSKSKSRYHQKQGVKDKPEYASKLRSLKAHGWSVVPPKPCSFELRDNIVEDIIAPFRPYVKSAMLPLFDDPSVKAQIWHQFATHVYVKVGIQLIHTCRNSTTDYVACGNEFELIETVTPYLPSSIDRLISGIGSITDDSASPRRIQLMFPKTTIKTAFYNANVHNNMRLKLLQLPVTNEFNQELVFGMFWADEEGHKKVKVYAETYLKGIRQEVYKSKDGKEMWYAPPIVSGLLEQDIVNPNIKESLQFWQIYYIWSLNLEDFICLLNNEKDALPKDTIFKQLKLTYCSLDTVDLLQDIRLGYIHDSAYEYLFSRSFKMTESGASSNGGCVGQLCVSDKDDVSIRSTPFTLGRSDLSFATLLAPSSRIEFMECKIGTSPAYNREDLTDYLFNQSFLKKKILN